MYLLMLALACSSDPAPAPAPAPAVTTDAGEAAPAIDPQYTALFKPLPEAMTSSKHELTDAKVDLGRMLYYDKRLSVNDSISCNSCHLLDKFGVDNEATSPGHDGTRGARNSNTSYNAALQIAQFWDGRAADVEEQAEGPILNPIEMGMPSEEAVVEKIKAVKGYHEHFAKAFPDAEDPITYKNIAGAIGAFERKLVTPAPFDAYLKGDPSALTDAQAQGLATFVAVGCATCHIGPGVGGSMFQKLGLVEPYETDDIGRMEVTGNEGDRHVFKVPTLRNVTKTAPYFHNGKVATLEESVKLMGKHQLGKDLADDKVAEIVAFLGALEGAIPHDYIKEPELPQ